MRIVLRGAGSYVFSTSVLHDAIIDHRIPEVEIALVDLDDSILETMVGVGRAMAADVGIQVSLESTTDRTEVLSGADFVILCAEAQGARRWRDDHEIVCRYDMPDQARECGGLGGLAKALRTCSLALSVAEDMETLAPGAVLLDVTNPMPRVVTSVLHATSVPAYGFCNAAWGGYPGYQWLARLVGREASDLDVITAGLNHFAWLLRARDRRTGEDLIPKARDALARADGAEARILAKWLIQFGAIGMSGPSHMGEYLPYDPMNHYHTTPPFHGDRAEREERIAGLRAVAEGRAHWSTCIGQRSWERPVDLAAAIHRGVDIHVDMVNLANGGHLPDLPEGRVVEAPARTEEGQVRPVEVPPMPPALAELCRSVSDVIQLSGEAAAEGDVDKVHEVVRIDPAIPDTPQAHAAIDDMLATHGDLLTRFA
jgi:alpha-galactosidase